MFSKEQFTAAELIEYLQTLPPDQVLSLQGDHYENGYLVEWEPSPPSPPAKPPAEGTVGWFVREIYEGQIREQLEQDSTMLKRIYTIDPADKDSKFVTFEVYRRTDDYDDYPDC